MIVEKTFISDGDCVVSRKAFEQTVEQNERYRALGTIDTLTRLQRDYSDLRNELCLACGKYVNSHLGLCNNCRWYDSVDVNKMDCAAAAMEKGEGK